jgi:acetylornithine deacetylase/succinyl-diaminopimelate desuccinylase-like protein
MVRSGRVWTRAAASFLLLLLGSGGVSSVRGADTKDPYPDMAVDLLQQYLRIDTTVPPGNELKGALFYKQILDREGIPSVIDEFAPGRANILATLKGSGAKRPLILANHIDVVPADPARWKVPPFSGLLKDGVIHGRGAEDMKTEGILQLLALVRLHREKVPLDRDVLFLGTADEEANFAGALRAISPQGWRDRLSKAEFLITEGGENILGEDGKPEYFGVETGEKGPYWMVLSTTGTPGHGSRPITDSALNRLIRALERVRLHKTSMKVLPSVQKFFQDQAKAQTEPRATWYRDMRAAIQDPRAAETLYADREVSALLRNTISITIVKAGYKTNVIPGTAEAELDVRLLPGEDPKAFLAEITKVIDDPTVTIKPRPDFRVPNESPVDTELFKVIESTLKKRYPGVPVTTKMLTGATEAVLYRPLGIHAYGFTPLLTTAEEVSTGHGDDERINEKTVRESTGVFYEVVKTLCESGVQRGR